MFLKLCLHIHLKINNSLYMIIQLVTVPVSYNAFLNFLTLHKCIFPFKADLFVKQSSHCDTDAQEPKVTQSRQWGIGLVSMN